MPKELYIGIPTGYEADNSVDGLAFQQKLLNNLPGSEESAVGSNWRLDKLLRTSYH